MSLTKYINYGEVWNWLLNALSHTVAKWIIEGLHKRDSKDLFSILHIVLQRVAVTELLSEMGSWQHPVTCPTIAGIVLNVIIVAKSSREKPGANFFSIKTKALIRAQHGDKLAVTRSPTCRWYLYLLLVQNDGLRLSKHFESLAALWRSKLVSIVFFQCDRPSNSQYWHNMCVPNTNMEGN